MSMLGPRIPVSVYLPREDPPVGVRKTPALLKRRSVSSMKEMLPLALPSSHPSTGQLPTEPFIEPTMDADKLVDLLPEMLARDLEISSAVFEAKNMTAGTPSMSLFDEKNRSVSCPGRIFSYASFSRAQPLGAIEERDSVVSFLENENLESQSFESASSDGDSVGTDASACDMPPSIRLREQSIITAATSLTSATGHPPSPKDLMSPDRAQEYSWIEIDSDDDEIDDEAPTEDQPVALSPRPRTPPGLDSLQPSRIHHSSSQSLSALPRRQLSVKSIDVPIRGASLGQTFPESICDLHIGCRESRTSDPRRRTLQFPHKAPGFELELEPENNSVDLESLTLSESEESINIDVPSWPRPNTVYMQNSRPPSPLPSVQTWLDQSNPLYHSPKLGDDLVKAIPLPPDTIETLRVSIACFPETMLLSSSLTIETIRSYSRKVRQPTDIWREPLTTSPNPRRSMWRKVVSHGRESLRLHRSTYDVAEPHPPPVSQTPWAPLRHVFGSCSDYICDALYAHIIAYNYISRVPRSNPAATHGSRLSIASNAPRSDDSIIPKKAASLLGLGNGSSPARRKKLAALGLAKDAAPSTTVQDNAARNIEAGLMRCIHRLIATAKMMAENGVRDDKMVVVESADVDMIFLRSLCEIVRIAEEA